MKGTSNYSSDWRFERRPLSARARGRAREGPARARFRARRGIAGAFYATRHKTPPTHWAQTGAAATRSS